ncbi:MAG: hypothetical protein PHV13_04735 [Candidatus ainarchaeum sp.]|nr:hypothetical protein [Candidatus ainarchaeum sp.]
MNTKKKNPGKDGANTAAITPVQISSVKDLAQVILKLHGESGQPIVEALLKIEQNAGAAITNATGEYVKTVNSLGLEVFAAKKAATDASDAAERAQHSVDQAKAAVADANKIVDKIPHAINEALREQLTVTVPVASAGGVAQEQLMGGKLIAYLVEKLQLLEAAYTAVKTQLSNITAAPSLNAIMAVVDSQLIAPLFKPEGAITVASTEAQASAMEAKTALAQIRNELKTRDESTAALIVACKTVMGEDFGGSNLLAEVVVNAATPIVIGAIKTETYLQSVPDLADVIGKGILVKVLEGFKDSSIAIDALCRADGITAADLATQDTLRGSIERNAKTLEIRAGQCLDILARTQEAV